LHTVASASSKRLLVFLLAAVFLSRLIFALIIWKIDGAVGFHSPDTITYTAPAESMLHGSFSAGGLPEIFRTPGYPLLLLPAVALGHLELIAILENILLATFSAWLIWRIVSELWPDSWAAIWAVLLYCLEPMGLLQAEKVLTETAFTAMLLLFIWIVVRFLRGASYGKIAWAALVLGCATYLRPIAVYLGLWLVPVFLFFPRSLSWRQRTAGAILFPVMLGLSLAPWIIRNARVADYKGFSATGDMDLYFYPAAAVRGKLENKPFIQEQTEMGWNNREQYFQEHPEQRNWSRGKIARFCGTEARRIILSHLSIYAPIHARGCMMTIANPGVTELMRDMGIYPILGSPLAHKEDQGFFQAMMWLLREYPFVAVVVPLMTLQLLLYYGLALAGLRHLAFDIRVFFFLVVLYFVLISGIPGAVSRWRAPFMPIVCICAGVAIAQWKARRTSSQVANAG
jgi:4-amino-4-deoxy-L-arabinose transferase-like glycosyltransferase